MLLLSHGEKTYVPSLNLQLKMFCCMLIVLDDRKTTLTSILINQEERYHLDDERQIISNVIISENCVGIPKFSVNCFKNDRLQTFQKFHIDKNKCIFHIVCVLHWFKIDEPVMTLLGKCFWNILIFVFI